MFLNNITWTDMELICQCLYNALCVYRVITLQYITDWIDLT